jgi:hypothetical protein
LLIPVGADVVVPLDGRAGRFRAEVGPELGVRPGTPGVRASLVVDGRVARVDPWLRVGDEPAVLAAEGLASAKEATIRVEAASPAGSGSASSSGTPGSPRRSNTPRLFLLLRIPAFVLFSIVVRKARPPRSRCCVVSAECLVVAGLRVRRGGADARGSGSRRRSHDRSRRRVESVDDESRQKISPAPRRASAPEVAWIFGRSARNPSWSAFLRPEARRSRNVLVGGAPASSLGDALRAALGTLPADANPELVVATDGAVPPLGTLPRRPARTSIVPLASTLRGAVRLDAVRPASAPVEGAPFELVVRGHATDGVEGTLKIAVDEREVGRAPFRSPPGAFSVTLPMHALPRGAVSSASTKPADREPADNAVGVVLDVAGPTRVLLVAPEGRNDVATMLAAQGIEPLARRRVRSSARSRRSTRGARSSAIACLSRGSRRTPSNGACGPTCGAAADLS